MVRVTAVHGWAVVAGVVLGLGLWTLVGLTPRVRGRTLAERVAPHLVDVSAEARAMRRRTAGEPASVLVALASPVVERGRGLLSSVLGGDATILRRMRQAGIRSTVSHFRSRQLLWAAAGAAVGLLAAILLSRVPELPAGVLVVVGVLAPLAGVIAPEQELTRRAKGRAARVTAELPTVLEFLSLALSAGETVRDAVRRVGRVGTGELAGEFADVMADVDLGVPLTDALHGCATDLDVPALSRATEQLVGAIERGSPLAEVLRAQAQDCRDDAKRALLEASGRKEIAMLVPLVFLILPVTIVFAIFPATLVLEVGF